MLHISDVNDCLYIPEMKPTPKVRKEKLTVPKSKRERHISPSVVQLSPVSTLEKSLYFFCSIKMVQICPWLETRNSTYNNRTLRRAFCLKKVDDLKISRN